MIKKDNRLPVEDFLKRRDKKTVSTKNLVFKIATNPEGVNRCAVVTGAKVDKKAVRRHRIKRVITDEIARAALGGVDVLVLVSSGAGKAKDKELRDQVKKILKSPRPNPSS